jgi:hypothetical protein
VFLKKAGAAGTAAATGLAASPPLDAQTVTARPAARSADLILSNAKVITVDHDFTIAQAIAIAGDRILAVGSNDALAAHTAPETRVIDLKGRTVHPVRASALAKFWLARCEAYPQRPRAFVAKADQFPGADGLPEGGGVDGPPGGVVGAPLGAGD